MKFLLPILMLLMTSFSFEAQCNPGDFNADGHTDTIDLLTFLTYYDCQVEEAAPFIVPAWNNFTQDVYGGNNGYNILAYTTDDTIAWTDVENDAIVTWIIDTDTVVMLDLKFKSLLFPDGIEIYCDGLFETTCMIEYDGCVYERTAVGWMTYSTQSPDDVPACENDFTMSDQEDAYWHMIFGPPDDVIVTCDN